MNSIDEMALWTRVVMGAGYPVERLVPYLMAEFGLDYDDGYSLLAVADAAYYGGFGRRADYL